MFRFGPAPIMVLLSPPATPVNVARQRRPTSSRGVVAAGRSARSSWPRPHSPHFPLKKWTSPKHLAKVAVWHASRI